MEVIRDSYTFGDMMPQIPLFSIADDDCLDKMIPTSKPSSTWTCGYLSILYPMIRSISARYEKQLGGKMLSVIEAAEGQRLGFTDPTPNLNENGRLLKHLQDYYNWEISCHSMTARFAQNSWDVPSMSDPIVSRILQSATYSGETANASTSIYCEDEKKKLCSKFSEKWVG